MNRFEVIKTRDFVRNVKLKINTLERHVRKHHIKRMLEELAEEYGKTSRD